MKKTTAVQLAALAAAAVLTAIVISYSRADFDLSFITRPDSVSKTTGQPYGSTSSDNTAAPPVTGEKPLLYSDFLSALPRYSALADAGYTVSDEIFKDGFYLALIEDSLGISLPTIYSLRNYTVRTVEKSPADEGGYISTVSKTEVYQPVIRNYYGYLLVDNLTSTVIYGSDGAVLCKSLEPYEPAYLTDSSGNPLFLRGGHYYVLSSKGTFVSAGIDEALADITPSMTSLSLSGYKKIKRFKEKVEVDIVVNQDEIDAVTKKRQRAMLDGASAETAAAEYPLPDPIFGKEERELWGYKNASGTVIVEPKYYAAYNFNDNGLAAVCDEEGKVYLIDMSGEVAQNPHENELKIAGIDRRAYDGWYLPDTYGPECAGMFTFDNGLMLVRRKMIDKVDEQYGLIHTASDSLALIYKDGSYFPVPEGYELVAYSEGILLLKRNGLYGFMNKHGEWIADPEYVSAQPFSEGLAVLEKKDGTFGMISSSGETVLEFVYHYITPCSGGVTAAMAAQYGWTIMYKMVRKV